MIFTNKKKNPLDLEKKFEFIKVKKRLDILKTTEEEYTVKPYYRWTWYHVLVHLPTFHELWIIKEYFLLHFDEDRMCPWIPFLPIDPFFKDCDWNVENHIIQVNSECASWSLLLWKYLFHHQIRFARRCTFYNRSFFRIWYTFTSPFILFMKIRIFT